MVILGIDHNRHDSAAALIIDGEVVAMAEEERFNRRKHSGDIPVLATQYCLTEAGLKPKDIDHLAFFYNPYLMIYKRTWQILRYFPKSLNLFRREAEAHTRIERMGMFFSEKRLLQKTLFNDDPGCRFRFHYVIHHLAHGASAFYLSPFEKAAILSVDGAGEWTTTWMGQGHETSIEALQQVVFPHSLGLLYSAVTDYLGFKAWSDEGKVMGLAAYGDETYYEFFDHLIELLPEGRFRMNMDFFEYHTKGWSYWVSDRFIRQLGPKRQKSEKLERRHQNIATGLQYITEKVCLHLVDYLAEKTGEKNLCMAGGVALNCVMNGRVFRESAFEDIYIQPIANDAGTALGAALWVYHSLFGKPRKTYLDKVYLGPGFTDEACEQALKAANVSYRKPENLTREVAQLIADGKIIGWFQGRMEVGPRALGNRSILSDPRKAEMKDILNAKVKHRESFRPFAPSVTLEGAYDYFESLCPSPFMIIMFDVIKEKQNTIPAITHVDGTARVQTVTKAQNPRYYQLLKDFEAITGVPVLINTSFNVMGQPIVCTPQEAIECFIGTEIDFLVLENLLAWKEKM